MRTRFWYGLLVVIVAPMSDAAAVTVTPVQVEMKSIGVSSHAVVSVVNDSASPLPIEAIIARTHVDDAGRPNQSSAEDDFLVIPPQALIPPGATQNFRLQWLGEPLIAQSQNYMLYLNQVPVKPRRGTSNILVVFSMGVMLNVAPPIGQPSLKIVGRGIGRDALGQRRPSITVENRSNVHALFSRASVTLRQGDWQETIAPDSISQTVGIGLIPAGGRRTFTLPAALPNSVDQFDASIDYAPKR